MFDDPIPGFRFGVFFFVGGVVFNPIDIRFQRVSGLSASIDVTTLREGGENLYTHRLPNGVTYGNLVLERGMIVGSPLNIEFNIAMTAYKFQPSNVLVTALGEDKLPRAAWLFLNAYPVKWATSDLDANQKNPIIDTMELAYTRMQIVRT